MTPELARDIKLADTKTRLEDLYLPYKQKRRTKGQIALEAGLGELADGLFNDPTLNPETEAARFVDAEKGVADVSAHVERVVTSDRSRGGREGVGGCNETTENESARERW